MYMKYTYVVTLSMSFDIFNAYLINKIFLKEYQIKSADIPDHVKFDIH